MSSFLDGRDLPVLYESLPPARVGPDSLDRSAEALERTLRGFGDVVDALLVPQVEDESEAGLKIDRPAKDDAVAFAARYLEVASPPAPRQALVAQPLTQLEEAGIRARLDSMSAAGIGALAVVGPPSSEISRASPTSTLAAIACCAADGRLAAGAIAIHARRGEPARMLAKTRAGARFFISQIYYHAESMTETISEYGRICRDAGVEPARVFLSLVPVISPPTARLMARVINPGRRLPEPAAAIPPAAIGSASIAFLCRLLAATLEAGVESSVPLGVSVGHVTERNVRLSLELLAAAADFR